MTKQERQALALRYADGELTIHELRQAGHESMIQLLSDLHELGRRLPLAGQVGPNLETRREGLARLASLVRP